MKRWKRDRKTKKSKRERKKKKEREWFVSSYGLLQDITNYCGMFSKYIEMLFKCHEMFKKNWLNIINGSKKQASANGK